VLDDLVQGGTQRCCRHCWQRAASAASAPLRQIPAVRGFLPGRDSSVEWTKAPPEEEETKPGGALLVRVSTGFTRSSPRGPIRMLTRGIPRSYRRVRHGSSRSSRRASSAWRRHGLAGMGEGWRAWQARGEAPASALGNIASLTTNRSRRGEWQRERRGERTGVGSDARRGVRVSSPSDAAAGSNPRGGGAPWWPGGA
jgi:hypothetical protein